MKKLDERIKDARCPDCGRKVFVPSVSQPSDDPVVWCRDMGHWAGKLSECEMHETEPGAWLTLAFLSSP